MKASWIKKLDEWVNQHRPAALVGVAAVCVAVVAFIDIATGSDLYEQLFFPERKTVADVRFWSALVYALAFAVGLPVAFLLWHWRDRNVRDQIENSRKDINLKEFQEVQLRAAGALDEKLPVDAREQLQIAALHQLRGFLRGDYGESFKRPAFELLLAGHAAAIERIGVPQFQSDIQTKSESSSKDDLSIGLQALYQKLTSVDLERMKIIRDEFDYIFCSRFPLHSRRFDLLNLSGRSFSRGSQLHGCQFFATRLAFSNFDHCNLTNTNFELSDLSGVIFSDVNLFMGRFDGAHLHQSKFLKSEAAAVTFNGARVELSTIRDSFFYGAHLLGADLSESQIINTDLRDIRVNSNSAFHNVSFDSRTVFDLEDGWDRTEEWISLPIEAKNAARKPWLARGMLMSSTTNE